MKRFLFIAFFVCAVIRLPAQSPHVVYVSDKYTTHFYFPTDIIYTNLSNEVVATLVPEEVKETVAVIAHEPFDTKSNITMIGANGKIHTYILKYAEHPSTLLIDEKNKVYDSVPDTLTLSTEYTTHLIYSTDVIYSDNAYPEYVEANRIESIDNILYVKAVEPFEGSYSLAVLESDGRFHTYVVKSGENDVRLVVDNRKGVDGKTAPSSDEAVTRLRNEDAPLLRTVYDLPQNLYHIASRKGRIEVVVENIFTYSDIMYVTLRLTNHSGVSYETKGASFDVKGNLRDAIHEEHAILPKSRYGTLTTPPGGTSKITYSMNKMTLAKGQRLLITIYETGGNREYRLYLNQEDVNLAKKPGGSFTEGKEK